MKNELVSDGDLKIEVLKNDVWVLTGFRFYQKIFVEKRFNCPNFCKKTTAPPNGSQK
jgi:hypothetical protein